MYFYCSLKTADICLYLYGAKKLLCLLTFMKKKRQNSRPNQVKDPLAVYKNAGITFSTLETQGDYLLLKSMEKSPVERLAIMFQLINYAFKSSKKQKLIFKNAKIIFSGYEYIPS